MNGVSEDELEALLNESLQELTLEEEDKKNLEDYDIEKAEQQIKELKIQINQYTQHIQTLHQVYQEKNVNQIQQLVLEMKTKNELQQSLQSASSTDNISATSSSQQQLDNVKFNVAGKIFEISRFNVLKHG